MSESGRTYLAIDLKSFYASVECVERGLDPLATRLVVADNSRTSKTICLAVSPALKACGIGGRPRLFEVEQRVAQCKRENPALQLDYLVAKPRMALYMQYSTRIYGIYLRYVSAQDVHVYSIDEVFIDVTSYLATYRLNAHDLARTIIADVLRETGITATAGIGTNMYLAKVAMDIVAKHLPADADGVRIAQLDERSYREQLWSHRPLTDFWRVGRGIAARLQGMGIATMGQLARASLRHEGQLYREFGVNAELLIDHAWGWEPCTIAHIKAYRPQSKSMGSGQVLQCPYDAERARVVVREMADQLALDLVAAGRVAGGITLGVGYDRESLQQPECAYSGPVATDHYGRQVPKSAHGSAAFAAPTSSGSELVAAAMSLFSQIVNPALLVRRLNLVATQVADEHEAMLAAQKPRQLDLFADNDKLQAQREQQQRQRQQEHRMQQAVLSIKQRFGKNAILRGTSYADGATQRERNQQIGGHHE